MHEADLLRMWRIILPCGIHQIVKGSLCPSYASNQNKFVLAAWCTKVSTIVKLMHLDSDSVLSLVLLVQWNEALVEAPIRDKVEAWRTKYRPHDAACVLNIACSSL